MPIFVGVLHGIVHFTQLNSREVQTALAANIEIMGESQSLWNTWGIMSFMMGMAFIVIGLLNISTFLNLNSWEVPPPGSFLITLFYLACVIYAGYNFDQSLQFWGGIFGFVALGIAFVISISQTPSESQDTGSVIRKSSLTQFNKSI